MQILKVLHLVDREANLLRKSFTSSVLLYVSIFLTISGCVSTSSTHISDSVLEQPGNSAPKSTINVSNSIFWAVSNPTLPQGMTHEEFMNLNKRFQEEFGEKYGRILDNIVTASTWQIADQRAKELLSSTQSHPFAFCFHQEIASSMLRSFFMNLAPDKEVCSAMIFYLNILRQYKYDKEINLYIQILPKLRGYLPSEEIQDIAGKCINSVNKWYRTDITVEKYFLTEASKQLKSVTTQQSSSSGITEADVAAKAQSLRSAYLADLPQKIAAIKKIDRSQWFRPVVGESIVILSFIAEGK